MAKKKIDGAATAASEPEVSGVVSPGSGPTFDTVNYGVISTGDSPAERDLDTLIEAQKIRRDPARFMAAKALPAAQKHYIV